jgi:transcriptional regulator
MYLPPQFEVNDRAWVMELIDRNPFGSLVTAGAPYPRVTQLPLVARPREGELRVVGHVARANPHSRSILEGEPATILVQGPHAYVSASWYERPYETVPTWNYVAAHLCGRLRECDAWEAVRLLAERTEGAAGWDPQRLDPGYRDGQLRGIVAFEMRVEELYAKAKLSQNRTQADRERVLEHLAASKDQIERACAAEMARFLAPEDAL